jgi:hypothetical protein
MKHYEVVRAYGPWSVGHVFTGMQGNEARTLMARGLIKEVTQDPSDKPKKGKAVRAPADRMMTSPVNRG